MTSADELLRSLAEHPEKLASVIRQLVQEQTNANNSKILGDIVWLMMRSPLHRRWPLGQIEKYVIPAIHHKQYRLFYRERAPIGYVSWAWLSPEIEDRYLAGGYKLTLADWKSGDLPWIIDFVVPFGDIKFVRKALRSEKIFPRAVKAIRPDKNGTGQIVMQFGSITARHQRPWRTRKINIPQGGYEDR